ncbi:MAG: CPBP family intramembrane metalloprotease [Pirellulales bacterium]|nr:CPBP family intramembrane metalloprotease [Pirellulales bacterium]
MEEQHPPAEHFALVATLFEASLAVVAVGLGWLVGCRPAETFRLGAADAGWGLLATLPPLALFWLSLRCSWRPLARLARLVDERLVPLFRQCRVAELAAISLVAGIGEEMLFRGLIQGGTAQWIGGTAGVWIGLAAGSLVFGLAHPISPAYSILTALIGLYLGWLWIATGNLLVPIVAHAVYDFAALVYLVNMRPHYDDRADSPGDSNEASGEENPNSW